MTTLFSYERKGATLREHKLSKQLLSSLLKRRGTLIWLDLERPSSEELHILQEVLAIHPLVCEDMSHSKTRAKLESYPGYHYLILYALTHAKDIEPVKMDYLVGKNFLVTSRLKPLESVHRLIDHRERIGLLMGKGLDFLVHAIVDTETDNLFPLLEKLDDRLDEIEEVILTSGAEHLDDILSIKKELLKARRIIWPQREIIMQLTKGNGFITAEAVVYYRDVYDHIIRVAEAVDTYRDILASTMEAYLSVQSNRLNEIMKVLTIFASILMPMTLITGIYGMNFKFMPELTWPYGYAFALTLIAGTGIVLLIWFRKKGWA